MPSFDLRIVASPVDLPDSVVLLDMSTAGGDVVPDASTPAIAGAVRNRSPGSYRLFQAGDPVRAPWWDAQEFASVAPAIDGSAFGGAGGLTYSSSTPMSLSAAGGFPSVPAGPLSLYAVADFVPGSGHGLLFHSGSGFGVTLDNGGHLATFDASGTRDSGVASVAERQVVVATMGASAGTSLYRNGTLLANYAYTATALSSASNFLGGNGSSLSFAGSMGAIGVFKRLLCALEVDYLSSTLAAKFGFYSAPLVPPLGSYAPPVATDLIDPANGSFPSRINSIVGHGQRYLRLIKPPSALEIYALVVPTVSGSVDSSTNFVPYFVEWPKQGIEGEPVVVQDAVLSGVCRLRLRNYGHYMFGLYRPGGGAQFVHLNLEPS